MRPLSDEHARLAGAHVARPDDSTAAPLAAAFLALADAPAPVPSQRSATRMLCALLAAGVLALAAPLAWASPAPRDQPAATAAGKTAGVEVDDDEPEDA
jgi:ferric-dicitrate binding protein FerR (iron transport regulator)